MKTYKQTISKLAEFRYDKEMSGAMDTRVNVDQVAYIFEKTESEVQFDISNELQEIKDTKENESVLETIAELDKRMGRVQSFNR